ncbi:integral membrane sensor signal transduction histidine kinase [Syntrophobotulus glycolicus DSM 8271]|uniref:histidine kinase n=1 Tax=Syntrophobotulus glycolicus (strain DSM 8271 / FlGlyR) TaxID=645991 RepID=F0T2K9_SYNGF|nr:HAMP domain-containing sensor histidine kinase [Syntrophobotulus glycolicus]ADY55327.1 integral membrane sensor signal transduction histidine kinase [Syntrophobotulus glycolicus DSM 8271]
MNEDRIIRRQQLINMRYNLIAFLLIFTAFGLIVFNQARSTLYAKLDSELTVSRKLMESWAAGDRDFERQPEAGDSFEPSRFADLRNPRVIPLMRNAAGTITHFGSVNSAYYEQYLQYLPFDPNSLNSITTVRIKDQYVFRSLMIALPAADSGQTYLQLVINADGETALLQQMSLLIVLSILLFSALSILASYILSQKTMLPVKTAWKKQVEFVENVSHELRTPLSIVQNSVELLLTTPEHKIIQHADTLALVLNETGRLSKMVADMLTITRSGGTITELSKELFSLDLLVRTVSEPYLELAANQEKQFQLELNCPANLCADKSRIHQLLHILFDNALKYTGPRDRVTVRTEFSENKVYLKVADTGIGMSDEAREKVFDRFYREDRARRQNRNGTGLGLSIARWIVEAHHGSIRLEPNKPKGTTVVVRLPK